MKTLLLLATLLLSTQTLASGQVYFGKVSLMDRKDVDVIRLPNCRTMRNRPVSQLKLKVKQYPVEIDRLVIQFQNGGMEELYVRNHFPRGGESRWMDLRGGKRCLKKIVVYGDTDTWRRAPLKQSKVHFYGR